MMDIERMEEIREEIFELVLNIARLQCHGCYMEGGTLIHAAPAEIEKHIHCFREELEYRAKNALMSGDWR